MAIQKIVIKLEEESEIRAMLQERGIQSLQRQAGYVPRKTKGTWDDTQKLINKLPTDHILAASYEDSTFIKELIFSENHGTLASLIEKDKV